LYKKTPFSELYLERLAILENEVTIYPVCCEAVAHGRSDEEWLDAVLAGGAKLVQLRDKISDDRRLLEKAQYFRKKTREAGALFLVNDRFDIALLTDADGVHVGQDDLPPEEIRRLAPDWIIGLSCMTKEHVLALQKTIDAGIHGASYYNIGPIYPTRTKEGLKDFLGADKIRGISENCELPFTVMGGIKFENIDELVAVGARRIAVVTAINQAESIADATARWALHISEVQKNSNIGSKVLEDKI